MIFIPTENVVKRNNGKGGLYLIWTYQQTYDQNYIITFEWTKTPIYNKKMDDVKYKFDHDPFYLHVDTICYQDILPCSFAPCKCKPQLRYNKIIDKWFCNCASSAITTKNDDQSELEELLCFDYEKNSFDKPEYCNNPVEAIFQWNISMADSYKKINEEYLEKFKKIK